MIGLNALVMGTNSKFEAAQHRWLEEMTRSHRGPVGLLLHKPLFQADPEEDIVRERYVPKAARLRLLAALEQSSLRFVAAGHTHQSRQFCHAGIDHVWVPSTAFVVPDALQECIGDKLVGVTMLEIDANGHRFTPVVPAGVKANDLLDYSHVYPRLNAALAHRARDGEPCR